MKVLWLFEVFSLIVSISAVLTILFFLITGWGKSIWITEPLWFIRIPEIIFGIISIPFMIRIIWRSVTT